MGWDYGEDIRPHAYTKQEWVDGPHAMFYFFEADEEKLTPYIEPTQILIAKTVRYVGDKMR